MYYILLQNKMLLKITFPSMFHFTSLFISSICTELYVSIIKPPNLFTKLIRHLIHLLFYY